MYNIHYDFERLEKEIINFIKISKHYELWMENELGPETLLENVVGFDSLELAGLVAHLESLTDYDPFKEGFVEFFTIAELAKLFSKK